MQPTSKLDQGTTLKAILDREQIPQDQKYSLWESYAKATDPDAFFQQIGSSGLSKAAKYQVYYMRYPERIGQAKNAAAHLSAIPELDAYVKSFAKPRELSTSTDSSQPAAAPRPQPDVKTTAPPKPPGTRPTPALPQGAQQPPGLGGMPLPGVPSPVVEMREAPDYLTGARRVEPNPVQASMGSARPTIVQPVPAKIGDVTPSPVRTVLALPESAERGMGETLVGLLDAGQAITGSERMGRIAETTREQLEASRHGFTDQGAPAYSPQWFSQVIGSGIGSAAGFMAPGFGTAKAAGLLAKALPTAARVGTQIGAGTVLSSGMETAVDAGAAYREAIERGMTHEQAQEVAKQVAIRELPVTVATNVAEMAIPFVPGKAARTILGGAAEPTQELAQGEAQRSGQAAAGLPFQGDLTATRVAEGVGGLFGGGVVGAAAPYFGGNTPPPPGGSPPSGPPSGGGGDPLSQWQGPAMAPVAPPRPPGIKPKKGGKNGQVKTETQAAPEALLGSPQVPVSANAETPAIGAAPAVPPPVPPQAEPGAAVPASEINGQVQDGAVGAVGDLWQQVRSEDPKNVIPMDPMQIAADPLRFQFKSGMGEGGAGEDLRGLKAYDREKGGVLTLWTDPADGRPYIVNGHHRLELAQRTKAPRVDVRFLQVDTAEEARAAGALQNIAEGNGTALDAAKVFRDLGATPADIDALGVTIKGTKKLAYNGLGLAQLGPEAFRLAVNEAISPEVGALIGYEVKGPDQQMRVAEFLVGRGHGASEPHARTAIDLAKGSKTEVVNQAELTGQDNLFGDIMVEDSDFGERVDVVTAIKEQLRSDKRLFAAVAKQGASETLQRKGNVIAGEENQAEANQLKQITGLFDRLYPVAGPVNNIIGEAAQRVKNGEPLARVVREVYPAVREAVEVEAGLRPRVGGSVQPVAGDGVQRPVEGEVAAVEGQQPAAPAEGVAPPQPPGVQPVAFDQTAIGEQGRLVDDAEITAAQDAENRDAAAPLSRLFNTQIGARANDLDRSPLFTGELVKEDAPPQQGSLLGEPPPKPPEPALAPKPRKETPDVRRIMQRGAHDPVVIVFADPLDARAFDKGGWSKEGSIKAGAAETAADIQRILGVENGGALMNAYRNMVRDMASAQMPHSLLDGEDITIEPPSLREFLQNWKPNQPPKPPSGLPNAPDVNPGLAKQAEDKPAAAPEPRPEPDVPVFTPREQGDKVDKPARELASTQVDLPPEAADQVRLLADRIAEDDLAGGGREAEPHITALFGLKETPKAKAVQKALKGIASIEFQLGTVSVFPAAETGGEFDVVKIEVESPSLHAANKALREAFEYENNHPEYKPHVTLAYVKPGAGAKYAGMETGLEGQVFSVENLTISGKDRSKTAVALTKGKAGKVAAEEPQRKDPAPVQKKAPTISEPAAAPIENPKVEVQDAQKPEPPQKPSSTPPKPPAFRDPDLNDEQRESMTNIAAKRAAEAKAKFEAMRNRRGGQAMAKDGLPAEEVDLIADMAVPLMVERGLDSDLWWPQLQADLGDWISDHELPILKAAVKKYQALKQSVLAAPPKPPKEKADGDKKVGTEDAAGDRGSGVEQGSGQPVAVQSGGTGVRLDAETPAVQEEVVSSLQEKGVVSLGKSTKGRIVPRMITVGNPPTMDTSKVPKPKTYELKDVQAQSVAGAINAIDNLDGGYLIASGTGSGKSAIGSSLARHYIDQGKAVVILAPAEVLKFKKPTQAMPEGSYKVWFEQYGLEPNRLMKDTQVEPGKLYVGTYHGDLLAVTRFNKDTVVLFDESHALKNAGSKRTNDGIRLAEEAGGVVFMTATPADKPEHIQYLQRIGILEGGSVNEAMARLGMEEVEVDYKDPKTGKRRHYFYWAAKEKPAEIRKRFHELFDRMIETGRMRKDEIALDHLEMGVHQMEMPQECHDVLDMIEEAFFNEFGMEDGTMPPLRNAQMLGHLRRTQETFKIPQMVEMAKQEIAAGRKVIFFVSRVNWSPVGFNRIIGYEGPPGDQSPIYEYVQLYESDGTAKLLHKALVEAGIGEDRIGHIHGKPKKSPQEILDAAKRAEDPESPEAALAALNEDGGELDTDAIRSMDKFQAGNLDVLIATAPSGGTGINLDDIIGDFPRTVIVGTPEFDAVNNIQLMGRVYRLSTRSAPKIVYLFGDTSVDQWNARILGEKFATLHSVAKGEVGKISSAIYYDNSQSGPRLTKGGEVFTASQALSGRRSGDTVIFWDNDAELIGKILGAPVYSTAKGKKMIGIDVDQMPVAQKKMNAEEIRLEYGDSNEPTAWLKDNRPEYVVRFDADGNLVKQETAARPAWGKRYGNEVVLFGEQARAIGNRFDLPVEQTPRGKDMVRVHVDDLEKVKAGLGIEVEHSPAAAGDWKPRWGFPLKRIGNQPPKPPMANLKGAPPPKPPQLNAKSEPPRPPQFDDSTLEDYSQATTTRVAMDVRFKKSEYNRKERLYTNRAGMELIQRASAKGGIDVSQLRGATKSIDNWGVVANEIDKMVPDHWMRGGVRQLIIALRDLPSFGGRAAYVINGTPIPGDPDKAFAITLETIRHEKAHVGTLPLRPLIEYSTLKDANPELYGKVSPFVERLSQPDVGWDPDITLEEMVAYAASASTPSGQRELAAFGIHGNEEAIDFLTDVLVEASKTHGEKVYDVAKQFRQSIRDHVVEGIRRRHGGRRGDEVYRQLNEGAEGPLAVTGGEAGRDSQDRDAVSEPGAPTKGRVTPEHRGTNLENPPPKPPQLNAKYPSAFAEDKGYDERPLDELPVSDMAPAADFRADGDTVYLNGEAIQIFSHAQAAMKDTGSPVRHTHGMAIQPGFAANIAKAIHRFADKYEADNLHELADAIASAKVVVNVPSHQGKAIEQTVRHERAHAALYLPDESAELFDYETAEEQDFVLKTLADKVRESKAMQTSYGSGLRRRLNDYTLYHEIIGHFAGGQLDRLGLTQEEAGVLASRVIAWYSYEHGADIYGRLAGILGEEQYEALDAKTKAKMAGVRGRAGSLAGTPPPRPPGSDRDPGQAVSGRRPDLPRGAAAAGDVGRGSRGERGGVSEQAGLRNMPPPVPPFYSALERAIEQKMPNAAAPEQVRAILSNPANGVKPDEVKWTGIEEWLAKSGGKVAKADVLTYLKENAIRVEEVERDSIYDDLVVKRNRILTKIGEKLTALEEQDKLPGWAQSMLDDDGESVFDVAMEIAHDAKKNGPRAAEFRALGLGDDLDLYVTTDKRIYREADRKVENSKYSQYTHPGGENYRELLFTLPQVKDTYQSSHWEEPNVLAHVRFDERDGGKTLFIHEIQSDWHQAGREKGYKEKPAPPRREMTESEMREFNRLLKEDDYWGFDNSAQVRGAILDHADWRDRWVTDNQRLIQLAEMYRNDIAYWRYDTTPDANRVPPAPFSKSWPEMVLRRMLRYAAEGGYERLSWATGAMNTQLFSDDLRQRVEAIDYEKDEFGDIDGQSIRLRAEFAGGGGTRWVTIGFFDPATGKAIEKINNEYPHLSEVVGKSIAEKILDGKDSGIFEGDDLTIGGEGMKGFYDTILPNYAAKYVKKWGSAVEKAPLQVGNYTEQVWSIPISPEMRHSVVTKGQPLFNLKGTPPPKPPR